MADVAARKRARSPSPAYGDTLASPLEVLLKRRRRDTYATSRMPPPPVWGAPSMSNQMDEDDPPSSHGPSSPLGRGEEYFERRRQRQWERLQAPSLSQPQPTLPDSSPFRAHPPLRRSITNESMGSASEYEMEVARAQALSSSPVRHQPPGSTPFRANDWTPEERMREWGDEYARQNSLLHSLHLARYESHPSPSQHTPERPIEMRTPHRTPTAAASSTALPTPYRMRGPQETPGLAVSSPWASSPLHSPYAPHAPAQAPSHALEPEVAARYEEANRLLAELNVARMRRYRDEGM